jgi:cation transporter-like permease
MELKPATSIQKGIRSGIIADIDRLSDHRLIRLNHSIAKPPVYVLVIIFGFLVSMACFGAYQPHFPLIALFSLCTLFIGMVLYLILAMSDPFQGRIIIDPTSIANLIETLESRVR